MEQEKLALAIKNYINDKKLNPTKYESDCHERQERKEYYQSFTGEKILNMSKEDFYEYISKLWSMLIWGNKQYVVDKLINDNGFDVIKNELAYLVYAKDDIVMRWNRVIKKVKGLGAASISEILANVYPKDYAIFNTQTIKCFAYLGIDDMPKYNYQYTGEKYTQVCEITKEILSTFKQHGLDNNSDLMTVDYILWDEILPRVSGVEGDSIIENISKEDSKSLHDEIQSKLVDIGKLLGFESSAEVLIAHGAKVDAVWEAQIGNMGKAIYVFEVQSKGSIDSLILNLKKSQGNAAVQAVVAVSDEKQIEKIKKESKGVIDSKALRTWEINDVIMVHESLAKAHESINKLALVPDSFLE